MKYTLFKIGFLCLFLNSCMIGKMYVEPTAGPIAYVTFETDDNISQVIDVVRYTGEEYIEHKGEALAWLSQSEANYKGKSVKVKIPANQEFRFSIRHSSSSVSGENLRKIKISTYFCINHLGFIPIENETYKVKSSLMVNGMCAASVEVNSNGNYLKEKTQKAYKSCIDPNLAGSQFPKNQCTKDFNFRE